MKNIIFIASCLAFIGFVGFLGIHLYMGNHYGNRIYSLDSLSNDSFPVAIVFGAGVWENNEPSPVLYDRVWTAVQLYKTGKVKRLLLTGDNRRDDYNEPEVMKTTAMKLGVPEKDIVLDYAGRRTYDSCYRAIHIFGIKKAILVTQGFHLPRCLYFCDSFGIEALGVLADHRNYPKFSRAKWYTRETIALLRAWYNVNIQSPSVVMGEKEHLLD